MHARWIDPRDVGLVFYRDGGEHLADRVGDFAGDFLAFAEGEDGGARAGDGEAERSGGDRGALRGVEIRDELLAARLGDDVVDRAGNQAVVFLDEAAEEAAEVA